MAQAVAVCSLCLIVVFASVSLCYSDGSTKHLKDIVLGRCWDFQRQKAHETKNCSKIWEMFYTAFAYKDPCNTTFEDYASYFDEIGMYIVKPNKSLFWSGTYKHAHLFSDFDVRFTTLEDTMAGWIVNGLTWCGTKANTSDGINYSSCPELTTSCEYSTPFWGQASRRFAEHADGIVRVMVNGTRMTSGHPTPAYRRDSFFGLYELPNFNVTRITRLIILVVHNIDGPDLESCGNGSIKLLQEDARGRGIKTSCHDDPDDVRHLLCADQPRSRQCWFFKGGAKKVTQPMEDNSGSWKLVAIIMLGIVAAFCLIAAVIGIVYVKRRRGRCINPFNYTKHETDREQDT